MLFDLSLLFMAPNENWMINYTKHHIRMQISNYENLSSCGWIYIKLHKHQFPFHLRILGKIFHLLHQTKFNNSNNTLETKLLNNSSLNYKQS